MVLGGREGWLPIFVERNKKSSVSNCELCDGKMYILHMINNTGRHEDPKSWFDVTIFFSCVNKCIPQVKGSLHGSNSLSKKSKNARLLQKHTKAHCKVCKVKMPLFYMAKMTQKELKNDQRISTNIGLHQGQTGVTCTCKCVFEGALQFLIFY